MNYLSKGKQNKTQIIPKPLVQKREKRTRCVEEKERKVKLHTLWHY